MSILFGFLGLVVAMASFGALLSVLVENRAVLAAWGRAAWLWFADSAIGSLIAWLNGARAYRYEGEREAHADQLRETEVSLSLMATADASPEQTRMATDIEHGMEARLAVLLNTARLSLAEKRERDAIQAALQTRRAAFDAPAAIAPLAAPIASGGLLARAGGLFAGWRVWALAAAVTLSGWGMNWATGQRLVNAKRDLTDARGDLREAVSERDGWKKRYMEAHAQVIAAREQAAATAEAITAERQRVTQAAARERRRQRAIQDVIRGAPEPPDWGLRDAGRVSQRSAPDGGADGDPA